MREGRIGGHGRGGMPLLGESEFASGGRGGELGLGRPGTSLFQFKHCVKKEILQLN